MIRALPGRRAENDAAGHDNMLQLVQLRWLAVAGQLATILLTHFAFDIRLPLIPMLGVLAGLVVLNIASIGALKRVRAITNGELFIGLLLDVAALSAQLFFSGGATNPFVSLFLLQVVLGSVLLDRWSSWTIVAAIAARHGIADPARYFIDADAAQNAPGQPIGGLTVVHFSNSHLVYAITWYVLAMMTAAGFFYWITLRRRSDAV